MSFSCLYRGHPDHTLVRRASTLDRVLNQDILPSRKPQTINASQRPAPLGGVYATSTLTPTSTSGLMSTSTLTPTSTSTSTTLRKASRMRSYCTWSSRFVISNAASTISRCFDRPTTSRGMALSTVSTNIRTVASPVCAPSSSNLSTSSDSSVVRSTAPVAFVGSTALVARGLRVGPSFFAARRRLVFVSDISSTTFGPWSRQLASRKPVSRTGCTCGFDSTTSACRGASEGQPPRADYRQARPRCHPYRTRAWPRQSTRRLLGTAAPVPLEAESEPPQGPSRGSWPRRTAASARPGRGS